MRAFESPGDEQREGKSRERPMRDALKHSPAATAFGECVKSWIAHGVIAFAYAEEMKMMSNKICF